MTIPRTYNKDELKFIQEHLGEDPNELSLKYHAQPDKAYLISQIAAKKKLRKKLPHWLSFDQIQFPSGLPLEQASSEQTALLKASLVSGDSFIDLTGGLGVDTYYLSQSFKSSAYIEKQDNLVNFARHNFAILDADINLFHADAEEVIKESDADFVYLDPHRRGKTNQRQILLSDHEPNVLDLLPHLIKPGRISLIKTSPMLDINIALEQLKHVCEVWVISVGNDCKEVLYLIDQGRPGTCIIRTWNLSGNSSQYFEDQRSNSTTPIGLSEPLEYLYEPNSAVFKGSLQDSLALKHQLKKLHANSHLYTSKDLIPDYPGKSFQVKQVHKAWAKVLKGGRFNLINRNFPEKNSLIESRMRLKSSENQYILATKLESNRSVFIEAELVSPTN